MWLFWHKLIHCPRWKACASTPACQKRSDEPAISIICVFLLHSVGSLIIPTLDSHVNLSPCHVWHKCHLEKMSGANKKSMYGSEGFYNNNNEKVNRMQWLISPHSTGEINHLWPRGSCKLSCFREFKGRRSTELHSAVFCSLSTVKSLCFVTERRSNVLLSSPHAAFRDQLAGLQKVEQRSLSLPK